MDSTRQPPVTITVITYNSAKTVVKTLDSILKQTYPNLELVISDDCSSDDTVSKCRAWMDRHKERFVRMELITSDINTGVSANLNRGWDACQTEWDKDIAGDDILLPHCIQDNMDYVRQHPDAVIVFSKVRVFTEHFGRIRWSNESWHDYSFFNLRPEEQYHYLLYRGNYLPAVPCFYNINELRKIGFRHDERIPLLEDYPKWIALARKEVKFHFFEKTTVGYRHDSASLSAHLFSPSFFKSNLLLYLYYYQDEIKRDEDRASIYDLMCNQVLRFYTKTYNEATKLRNSWDYRVGSILLYPLHKLKDLILCIRGQKG